MDQAVKLATSHAEEARDQAQGLRIFMKLPAHENTGYISYKRLLDAIMCMEAHNKTLYSGLTDTLYRTIDNEATTRVAQVLGPSCPKATGDCQQLLQLLVGPLLSHIASNMLQAADACDRCDLFKQDGTSGEPRYAPLRLYSTHDSTLLSLLAVLGRPTREWPPFMSSLVLELWQVASGSGPHTHAVRAFYNMEPLDLTRSAPDQPGDEPGKSLEGKLNGMLSLHQFTSAFLKPYSLGDEAYKAACAGHPEAATKSTPAKHLGHIIGQAAVQERKARTRVS